MEGQPRHRDLPPPIVNPDNGTMYIDKIAKDTYKPKAGDRRADAQLDVKPVRAKLKVEAPKSDAQTEMMPVRANKLKVEAPTAEVEELKPVRMFETKKERAARDAEAEKMGPEASIEVEGEVLPTEEEKEEKKRAEAARERKIKQELAEAKAVRQGKLEVRQKVAEANEARRGKALKDREYLKILKEAAPRYQAGDREGMGADIKSDLQFLLDDMNVYKKGGTRMINVDISNASAVVFGAAKENAPIGFEDQKKEKKGFFARLFGRKDS